MPSSNPLVSIALCTYNGAKYIEEQIFSILNQTYKNFELIILDDCSTDETSEIVNRLAAIHPVIKFFKNEKNLGFNKNFEKAIGYTNGEYIAISDQDDVWECVKIEILINEIKDNWLIFSNSRFIDEKGIRTGQTLLNNFTLNNKTFKSLLLYNFVTGHTVLFKKQYADYFLPFPKRDFYDWWVGFIALYHNKLIYCDQILTNYRIHQNSFVQNKKLLFDDKIIYSQQALNHLKQTINYKNLNLNDLSFITKLKNNFQAKNVIPLIIFIYKHYTSLFPDLKTRTGLSLANYAIKYGFRKAL